ncbi:hypothetical protein F4806DRAFT_493975 [Annulohypoxylon nitens]|nr:hypothetical protein F4806DRAFT_493975 [Annulohypoxylon nitens]
MPGLTLNTEGAAVSRTPIYPPAPITSQSIATSATTSTTITTTAAAAASTAATTTATTSFAAATTSAPTIPPPNPTPILPSANTPTRSTSPQRPPISPITPPLNPIAMPPRRTYTHTTQQPQTSIAAPLPEPIDFDTNPDVLALKSAISVLQLQRRKAEANIAALAKVKSAAMADPGAFVRDLTSGRVGMEEPSRASSDGDSDSDEEMGDANTNPNADVDEKPLPAPSTTATLQHPNGDASTSEQLPQANPATNPFIKFESPAPPTTKPTPKPQPPPWAKLPKPQNVVRCPPINWSQYAVVGESLDKLHAEQVRRPTQGVPASLAADGRYEFSAAPGRQERYVGIAAPYAPGKDRIDRKSKAPRK